MNNANAVTELIVNLDIDEVYRSTYGP